MNITSISRKFNYLYRGIKTLFRDEPYQQQLPCHARHTASTSIKSNTRLSEFIANPDITKGQNLNFSAMENYLYLKEMNKMSNPKRYNVVPTLNDLGRFLS